MLCCCQCLPGRTESQPSLELELREGELSPRPVVVVTEPEGTGKESAKKKPGKGPAKKPGTEREEAARERKPTPAAAFPIIGLQPDKPAASGGSTDYLADAEHSSSPIPSTTTEEEEEEPEVPPDRQPHRMSKRLRDKLNFWSLGRKSTSSSSSDELPNVHIPERDLQPMYWRF